MALGLFSIAVDGGLFYLFVVTSSPHGCATPIRSAFMKRVIKIGVSGIGLIALILLLAFAFRGQLYSLIRTVDDPVQHKFVEAARKGDVHKLADLHAKGAKVDGCATYENGAISSYPALCGAITYHQPEAVRWLLDHGAQANQVFGTDTPLEIAEYSLGKTESQATALAIVEMIRARGGKRLAELYKRAE